MSMKDFLQISEDRILALGITPAMCVDWVRDAFLHKDECILSPKVSQKPTQDSFFNTMPCCLPQENVMGVKVVSRLPGNVPPLKSAITLFDMKSGELVALMDANWITAMRTGAIAALAAKTFVNHFEDAVFAFTGLGNISRAVLKCLLSQLNPAKSCDVWLLKFGDESKRFIEDFKSYDWVTFHETESREELVNHSDALFSAVTVMNEQFLAPDKFPAGYTLIPVHTKGFQDCDMVFDRIFGDDVDHEKGFKNFASFRFFAEFKDVLSGRVPGRQSGMERIICYNVGIALHDIWFATKVCNMIKSESRLFSSN